jgi:outer membrane protein insertion porin family
MRAALLALLLAWPAGARAQTPTDVPPMPEAVGDEATPAPALAPAPPSFGPRYVLEGIVVRGNHKTDTAVITRELGLAVGEVVGATDPRVEAARLRLFSLGYFLDVKFSLEKGARPPGAILVVTVEERGTIVANAIYLGTSEATSVWGGLDVAETNFLGRGIGLGGGFVTSTRPKVPGADPALALALRAAGPWRRDGYLTPYGNFLYSDGSEFFRARGGDEDSRPADFVAVRTRRAGGTLGVGIDMTRTVRVSAEGRFESIAATLPDQRTWQRPDGTLGPISFGIHEGDSRLAALGFGFDVDNRSDPVLPARGSRASVTLQTALPFLGSRYAFAKGVAQASWYHPVGRHVVGVHGYAGAMFGDAPYFERFFVGDLNLLLPPRALGLNFSTLPSRDFLGTSVAAHRYDSFAARVLVEYAVPLWRRHGFFYRGDAFAAFGAFALASQDDLRVRDTSVGRALPADLTADLGLRLDTYVGIFTFSVANGLGRISF